MQQWGGAMLASIYVNAHSQESSERVTVNDFLAFRMEELDAAKRRMEELQDASNFGMIAAYIDGFCKPSR
jgi:hypothetical protein